MIAAFDIDLHKIYCVGEDGAVLMNGQTGPPSMIDYQTFLLEIASPTSFGRGGQSSGTMFNLAKWAIHNIYYITMLSECYGESKRILVAPSNVWTHGYDVKTRHRIAGATAKNKDLRECQSMIWMHKKFPKDWIPLQEYMESL